MPDPCPFIRPELPPLIDRIAALPVDRRGYPVPFFVSWINGAPEFRLADPEKWSRCLREQLCWVCGQKLGSFLTFAIGPMCAVNRVTSEPPCHRECAEWSVQGCPFLAKPQMTRRADELIEANLENVSGIMSQRNPGVTLLWTTRGFKTFPDRQGRPLISLAKPATSLTWWREGRPATRAEIIESVDAGLPQLRSLCEAEEPHLRATAHRMLDQQYAHFLKLLPPA